MAKPKNIRWNEAEQAAFYKKLKALPAHEQGEVLLQYAEEMLQAATSANDNLLKAVESMLNLWTLKYAKSTHEARARQCFYHLYQKMGLSEKAQSFK